MNTRENWKRMAHLTTPDEIMELWNKKADEFRQEIHNADSVETAEMLKDTYLAELEEMKNGVLDYYRRRI